MDFIAFYRDFFAYDLWCNHRVLASLRGVEEPPADAVRLFAHILGAQRLWLKRMVGDDCTGLTPWPELAIDECAALIEEQYGRWMSYLDDLDGSWLDDTISYTTTKGDPYVTSIRDILTHVNNHSTYHRAQIARSLKQHSIAPPVTDYIAYVRERG